MKLNRFEIHYVNGEKKEFNAYTVVEAWLRAMSTAIILSKDPEVKHIVNHSTMEIFSDFEWDVSYSLKDKEYINKSFKTYSEPEVLDKILSYVKYVGGNIQLAKNWFNINKKQ